MRVEAPPLGGWEASKGIQNLEPITPALEGEISEPLGTSSNLIK